MEDLTIVTCNHNTDHLIHNLIKSIVNTCDDIPNTIVLYTGDSPPEKLSKPLWTEYYIPKTSHGNAVNKAFELVKTRYMLLVDSDVLFLKDISGPFEKFKEHGFALMGEVVGDRGGKSLYPRVNPWFCFIDLEQLKNNNIQFYDYHRTKVLKSEKIYDIGSTMYEDILNALQVKRAIEDPSWKDKQDYER
jgi:hypothetical protein